MRIKLDKGAFLPERAHATDAGLDIKSPVSVTIPPRGSAVINTGVHVEVPHGTAGILMSKSGLNVKHGITTSEGVIDEGYTGAVVAKLYNNSDKPYEVSAGQKITQLLIVPVLYERVEIAEEMSDTDRGDKGFGSTGI